MLFLENRRKFFFFTRKLETSLGLFTQVSLRRRESIKISTGHLERYLFSVYSPWYSFSVTHRDSKRCFLPVVWYKLNAYFGDPLNIWLSQGS